MRCPEIRPQIRLYWILFLGEILSLILFSPFILVGFAMSALGWLFENLCAIVLGPFTFTLDYFQNSRRDAVKSAHNILPIQQVQERLGEVEPEGGKICPKP